MSDSTEILYQYASGLTWPLNDAGWTSDRDVMFANASDGVGQVIGDGSAVKRYGRVQRIGSSTPADDPVTASEASNGRYVRLLRADPGGTVSVFGTTWTPFWWGFCARVGRRFLGAEAGVPAAAVTNYTLNGLLGLLAGVAVIDGWERNPTAAHEWNAYRAPPFNENGSGNCTATTYTFNGATVHLFDYYNLGGSATKWTIAKALAYLVAAFTPRHGPSGTTPWTFVDSSTHGTEELPETRVHGKTLLQVLHQIASMRRGLTIRADVDGSGNPRITLQDWKPASGITLDARDRTIEAELVEDTVESADHVYALSARPPLNTIALNYVKTGSRYLDPDGWTAGTAPTADPQSRVLRRYKLASSVLDDLRVELPSTGTGYTGARTKASGIGGGASARAAGLERLTALAPGDIGTTPSNLATFDDRSPARVFVRRLSGSGTWEDWTDRITVTIRSSPAGIELQGDPDHFADLHTIIETNAGEMRVVLGVREIAPLRESLNAGATCRGVRDAVQIVASIDQGFVPSGTPVGVSSGSLITTLADAETWDDTTELIDEVSRMADYAGRTSQPTLKWKKHALEWTVPPGTLVEDMNVGAASNITTDALVVRRLWTFSEGSLSTEYETVRPAPGQSVE